MDFLCEHFKVPVFYIKERENEVRLRRWSMDEKLYRTIYKNNKSEVL